MIQEINIKLDIPDGYEYVRYGSPDIGELYLDSGGCVAECGEGFRYCKCFIVRKIKQWRDNPTLPADYDKLAIFSDDGREWTQGRLSGWGLDELDDDYPWISSSGHAYKFCRVCD